ncbi:conserved hypothetical protein [Ricinus communis]|uniref:Uncharacterized protein n=1 Tax=Ricinus communis TaxID=3988 RepID=B9S4F9_RICCO|nr:conserved hypothetical protein [Ricinus communis]
MSKRIRVRETQKAFLEFKSLKRTGKTYKKLRSENYKAASTMAFQAPAKTPLVGPSPVKEVRAPVGVTGKSE